MQPKTIVIPFNYDNFIKTQRQVWTFSLKKVLNSYIFYTILPLTLLSIGLLLESIPSDIVGALLLLYVLIKWVELYSARKKNFKNISAYAQRFMEDQIDCTYTFTDQRIKYEDKEKLYEVSWSLFRSYSLYKDIVLLTSKDTGSAFFSINKKAIGEENFKDICDILKEKLPLAKK